MFKVKVENSAGFIHMQLEVDSVYDAITSALVKAEVTGLNIHAACYSVKVEYVDDTFVGGPGWRD